MRLNQRLPREFRNTTVCLLLSTRKLFRVFHLPDKSKTLASKGAYMPSSIQPNRASWESLVLPSFLQLLQKTCFSSLSFHYNLSSFIHQIYISHSILSSLHCISLQWKLSVERVSIFNTLFLHKASRLYYLR